MENDKGKFLTFLCCKRKTDIGPSIGVEIFTELEANEALGLLCIGFMSFVCRHLVRQSAAAGTLNRHVKTDRIPSGTRNNHYRSLDY